MTLGYAALIVIPSGCTVSVVCRLLATRRWACATATVVGQGRGYQDGETFVDSAMLPTIRFSLLDGSSVFVTEKNFILGPLNVGDQVEIFFDPAQPTHVVSPVFHKRFKIEILVSLFGLFLGSIDLVDLLV